MGWTTTSRRLALNQATGHLATASADGAPHAVPICFVLLDDKLYSVIDDKPKPAGRVLKRLSNIAENPRVAVVIDAYSEAWEELEYVLVRGTASLVADGTLYIRVRAALRRKYPPYRNMNLAMDTHPMIEIVPASIHYWHA